jgi:hypothetical protein
MSAIVVVSLVDRERLHQRGKRNPAEQREIPLVIVNPGGAQFVGGGEFRRKKHLV